MTAARQGRGLRQRWRLPEPGTPGTRPAASSRPRAPRGRPTATARRSPLAELGRADMRIKTRPDNARVLATDEWPRMSDWPAGPRDDGHAEPAGDGHAEPAG